MYHVLAKIKSVLYYTQFYGSIEGLATHMLQLFFAWKLF